MSQSSVRKQKELREVRKLAGLCIYCGGKRDGLWKSCTPCRKQTAAADGAKRGISRPCKTVVVTAATFRFTPLAEKLIAEKDVSERLIHRFLRRDKPKDGRSNAPTEKQKAARERWVRMGAEARRKKAAEGKSTPHLTDAKTGC